MKTKDDKWNRRYGHWNGPIECGTIVSWSWALQVQDFLKSSSHFDILKLSVLEEASKIFLFSEKETESWRWAKKLWRQLRFSTVFLLTMLIIKILILLGSIIGAASWDLASDYMAAHKHLQWVLSFLSFNLEKDHYHTL